jgi:hypothetical protein
LASKWTEIAGALPRLIMAVFIAVTVAVPLELKYFQPEITAQMAENYLESIKDVPGKLREGMPEIKALEDELANMGAEEEKFRTRRNELREQRLREVRGDSGNGLTGRAGFGPEARAREEEYKRAESDLEQATKRNQVRRDTVVPRVDELRKELDGKIKASNAIQEARGGFLEQLKALNQLAEKDGPVKNATLFLVILLSLIETTPVLIKLLARRGPYDDLLDSIEHKTRILKKKEISDFNSEINKELERYDSVSDARWLLEEQLRRGALNLDQIQDRVSVDLENARSEIAQATIAAWRQKELRDIKGAMNENGLHRKSGISL